MRVDGLTLPRQQALDDFVIVYRGDTSDWVPVRLETVVRMWVAYRKENS